jgi:hypothetical protein
MLPGLFPGAHIANIANIANIATSRRTAPSVMGHAV